MIYILRTAQMNRANTTFRLTLVVLLYYVVCFVQLSALEVDLGPLGALHFSLVHTQIHRSISTSSSVPHMILFSSYDRKTPQKKQQSPMAIRQLCHLFSCEHELARDATGSPHRPFLPVSSYTEYTRLALGTFLSLLRHLSRRNLVKCLRYYFKNDF